MRFSRLVVLLDVCYILVNLFNRCYNCYVVLLVFFAHMQRDDLDLSSMPATYTRLVVMEARVCSFNGLCTKCFSRSVAVSK